jgi:SAM-dependent methyltransferase
LEQRTDLLATRASVLHVAPEACIQRILRSLPHLDYVSVDLDSPLAMHRMDVTDLRFETDRFDAVICFHVLEHVPDDRRAISELFRVLRPGGFAILEVPLSLAQESTIEDPAIRSPRERERLFAQRDHVRSYGRDYLDRLGDAGFTVTLDEFPLRLPDEVLRRYGLRRWSRGMVVCGKQRPEPPAS